MNYINWQIVKILKLRDLILLYYIKWKYLSDIFLSLWNWLIICIHLSYFLFPLCLCLSSFLFEEYRYCWLDNIDHFFNPQFNTSFYSNRIRFSSLSSWCIVFVIVQLSPIMGHKHFLNSAFGLVFNCVGHYWKIKIKIKNLIFKK